MEKFGEIVVKEPPCKCLNVKGSTNSEEQLNIKICDNESELQLASTSCCIWMEEECMDIGKGPLKFSYNFQSSLRTTVLAIRALKVVPHRDSQDDNVDCNIVCRIYLNPKDFRTLQTFNKTFMGRVQSLLVEVENRREFTSERELIKRKLEDYSLAIFPDEEGFLLFKYHHEYTRPVHVLLHIDPPLMVMELCFPRSRLLLSTLSHERIPVTSLREAIDEFSRSPSGWPVVRREEHGGDWSSIHPQMPSSVELSEEHHTWNSDESNATKHTEPFLNDTVREIHKPFSMKSESSSKDMSTISEEDSVRSLVRRVVQLQWQENFSLYITIEKATLAILGHYESTAMVFVDAISRVVWKYGSESLGVYKLLLAAVEIPAVKKAVLKKNLLCLLLRQYELMTQIIISSTSSGSYHSHSTLSDTQMEIGGVQYFTCPQLGEQGTTLYLSGSPMHRTSTDVAWTQTGRTPTTSHQVYHSGSESTLSKLSFDFFDAPNSCGDISNVSRSSSLPETQEQRQNVPKLSFYWLIRHDGTRSSTNTGTTRTTISLPDGRSIVFGDERGGTDPLSLPLRGCQPAQHFTLTQGNDGDERFLNSNIQSNTVARTLLSWGMKLEHIGENGPIHSVAYSIKCTLLEIFCTFSPLNLNDEVCLGLENTRDYQLLFGNNWSPVTECIDTLDNEDIQHPSTLAVIELLAPPWQIFPGEQPPIRWGPTSRGSHLAFAVLHEFACRPLLEVDTSSVGSLNIRLFGPQDLTGEAHLSLIGGVKERILQIAKSSRIIISHIEEVTSLINLLCDFVASNPSSSQAPLVVYSCSDAFTSLESAIFCPVKVGNWRLAHFRAFHALLRLYRCILERATDVMLIDFLIAKLLEQVPWIKIVRDYAKAVLFSEKLDKKCDPEELACLRLGVWSYHTALVKVVAQNQRDENSQNTGYLPEDFQDSKPTAFGQDPLDYLSFLFVPESGLASQVLKKKDWAEAQTGPPLGGGIHAQVLLFLKLLFSIPSNEFMRKHEISSFYLNLHWTSFRRMYAELNAKKDETDAVICRLHLEVLRVILKHHTLDIFVMVRRLEIIACLADEIALEASISDQFGNFNPPTSQLTLTALELEAQIKPTTTVLEKLSDTEALESSGQYSFVSSSAAWLESSKAFSGAHDDLLSDTKVTASVDVTPTSESLPLEGSQSEIEWSKTSRKSSRRRKTSPRSSSDSVRKVISKTFSFRSSPKKSRGSITPSGEEEGNRSFGSSPCVRLDNELTSSRSNKRRTLRGKNSRGFRLALNRNTPSRIPKLGSRRSPRSNISNLDLFSNRDLMSSQNSPDINLVSSGESADVSRNASPSLSIRKSFPSIVMKNFSNTKIPRLPSQDNSSTIGQRTLKNSQPDESEETKKGNSFQAISKFFHKKKRTFSGGGFSLLDKGQSSKNPSSKKSQTSKKNSTLTGQRSGTAASSSKGFFLKKKIATDPGLSNSLPSKGRNAFDTEIRKLTTKPVRVKTIDSQQTRKINRTAKPVDGPSRMKIPYSPNHVRLNFSSSSSLTGRDSLLSYETSDASEGPSSRLKTLNVPLLNLSGIKDPSKETRTSVIGQTKISILNVGSSNQSKTKVKKESLSQSETREKIVSRESSSRTQKGKCTVSAGRSSKSYSESRQTNRTDDCSDGNGPPTFNDYCRERAPEREVPFMDQETYRTDLSLFPSKKPPSVPKSSLGRTTKTVSSVESQSFSHGFDTPSDFECTGNVAEDCMKVEEFLQQQVFYGLSSATFSSESPGVESSIDGEALQSRSKNLHQDNRRRILRPNSSAGTSKSPTRTSSRSFVFESRKSVIHESVGDSQCFVGETIVKSETKALEPNQSGPRESDVMPISFSEDIQTDRILGAGRRNARSSPSTSGFKTPYELDHFDSIEENSRTLYDEAEERTLFSCSSYSSNDSSSLDSIVHTSHGLAARGTGNASIVPKLQFSTGVLRGNAQTSLVPPQTPSLLLGKNNIEHGNEESMFYNQVPTASTAPRLPILKLNTMPAVVDAESSALAQGVDKTPTSRTTTTLSPTDELSSFSWLHVSAKDSITESEFARLINDGTKSCPTSTKKGSSPLDFLQDDDGEISGHDNLDDGFSLCPCEALRRDRFVYSDTQLRVVFVEVLLEGMLLEYNTRAARDRDRFYSDVKTITSYVPRTLKHHLNHKISEPVVKLLNERLLPQSKNLHRLLRLLCHSFFPVDLYQSVDHLGRGAFSHVHRCDLPFKDGPETCAIKIMDHPIGHNEMSSIMDVYSEIYILEQFRDDPNVCSLYDYGVNKESVFMVMKDYKCSLLEWRKKFPDQCAGALKLFLRIFQDIVNAVKKLHDNNVVHFDLKCSNVLLEPLPGISEEHFWNPPTEEPPFRVVLADFGEARSYNNNWEAKTVRNRGTEFNKSPEMLLIAKAQRFDDDRYDRRKRIGAGPPSDVWALGCLLFELVTGELLQLDAEWSRFFVRVTTNTMNVVDKEKQKMLPTKSRTVIGDLLDYILVRTHLWRPNLNMLSRKLETVMISGRLGSYVLPRKLSSFPPVESRIVERISGIEWIGKIQLPTEKGIVFTKSVQISSIDCLINPWFLSDKGISLLICVKGHRQLESVSRLLSTASRASIELLEICLEDNRSIEKGHVDIIVTKLRSRKACFTCESGFENKTMDLIHKTIQYKENLGALEALMEIWRQLKI